MKNYLWKYWSKKIGKIENQVFDENQVNVLFKEDLFNLWEDLINKKISHSEFNKLSTDIKRAYHVAYSNFRKYKSENSFWRHLKINIKSLFTFKG